MQIVSDTLRHLLNRSGVLAYRIGPEIPPSGEDFLHELAPADHTPAAIVCFDNDVQMQAEMLDTFPADRVTFASAFQPTPAPSASSSPGPLLVEVDLESFALARVSRDAPWVRQADLLLLRCSLGFFWSGRGDVADLCDILGRDAFTFFDVIDYARPHLLKGPAGRVILIFVRGNQAARLAARFPHRHARVAQARAYLSLPIARAEHLATLAGRGSYGFAGGVFNPGAVPHGAGTLLVARGERTTWPVQRQRGADFLQSTAPLLIELDAGLSVVETAPLTCDGAVLESGVRIEDCRLVRHANQLLANHSVVSIATRTAGVSRPLRAADLRSRVGVSLVDIARRQLTFLGVATTDRPLAANEKNWTMFTQNDRLFALYSFQPYRLMCAYRWPRLEFETVLERTLDVPVLAPGVSVRNSINPVEYDDAHLLHVVHQVHGRHHYVFWAVLIDKLTQLPVKITARPLARSSDSAPATIVYICSAVVRHADVLFFGGINDCTTACWRVSRATLDSGWLPIAAAPVDGNA